MRRQVASAIGRLGVTIDVNADVRRTRSRRAAGGGDRPCARRAAPSPQSWISRPRRLVTTRARATFSIVDQLRANWAVLYITHQLEEVQRLGDRVTVFKTAVGGLLRAHATSVEELVQAMAGRPLRTLYPAIAATPGRPALRLDTVSTADGELREVSIEARFREILGIGGLVGCGKAAVGRAAFVSFP